MAARLVPVSSSVATEAIVVIDIVESTSTSTLFGWHAVGRRLLADLHAAIVEAAKSRGLGLAKCTGDGYLLTLSNQRSAAQAAIAAADTVFDLLDLIAKRNLEVPEELELNIRCAIHIGEVEIVSNDRVGPHVSFAFRLEGVSASSFSNSLTPVGGAEFPVKNYVLCSEEVAGIVSCRSNRWESRSLGVVRLKGFPGWHEIFQINPSKAPVLVS